MSESAAPSLKDLNLNLGPNVLKDVAGPETGLKAVVRGAERIGNGRTTESDKGGVVGFVENFAHKMGSLVGEDKIGQEVGAFANFASEKVNGAALAERADQMLAMGRDEQIKVLSQGMESVATTVGQLMDVRAQASEVSLKLAADGIKDINEWLKTANKQDTEAISNFFKSARVSYKDMDKKMWEMWGVQELVDKANQVHHSTQVGNAESEDEAKDFKRVGGPFRRLYAGITRHVWQGAKERVVDTTVKGATKADIENTRQRLVTLRSKAIAMASDAELIEMWQKRIVSSAELGELGQAKLATAGASLSDGERNKLLNGQELDDKFKRASQIDQASYFVSGDKNEQGFFGRRLQNATGAFNAAREKYLSFDIANASKLEQAGALFAEWAPLPTYIKDRFTKLAVLGINGVGALAAVPGKGVEFGIDRMESVLAGGALERMVAVQVAQQEAAAKLVTAMRENPSSEATAALARVLRGAETAAADAAMYAARVGDTLSMSEGKGRVAAVAVGAVAEAPRGLVDFVTGGVFTGEQTRAVAGDLATRMEQTVDGAKVMESRKAEAAGLVDAAVVQVEQWFDAAASDMKIPDTHRTDEAMEDYVGANILTRFSEMVRKTVGPDSWTKLGEAGWSKEVWNTITKGSERKSVEAINNGVGKRMAETHATLAVVSGKIDSGIDVKDAENMKLVAEAATLVTLESEQRKLAQIELTDVKRRSQLDKAYGVMAALGVGAVAAYGAEMLAQALNGPFARLAENMSMNAQAAQAELARLQMEFAKIPEIVSQQHQEWATDAAKGDISSQQVRVFVENAKAGGAELIVKGNAVSKFVMEWAKGIGVTAAALGGAAELLPKKGRLFSTGFLRPSENAVK